MGQDKQSSSNISRSNQKYINSKFDLLKIEKEFLPIRINNHNLETIFSQDNEFNKALAIVIGTKPDFYKQAPLLLESIKEGLPSFIISTGQHYDELLGYGIKEFDLENSIVCDLQIRGDLMEKSSDLIMKFGHFGRYLKRRYSSNRILPIVHGDTLVAGIATLSWVFGLGQKVGQNEAGLRSMSPTVIKRIKMNVNPTRADVEKFITNQLSSSWFLTREEPFPEQIDTWVCSSGTKVFFCSYKTKQRAFTKRRVS